MHRIETVYSLRSNFEIILPWIFYYWKYESSCNCTKCPGFGMEYGVRIFGREVTMFILKKEKEDGIQN